MAEPDETLVLARAKLNFAQKGHGDRCWERDAGGDGTYGSHVMALSDEERTEYLEQARHELRSEPSA
ncbi:hypothetical protein [uncultured Methylobacterium sp.]|uniref:hypothetical protein n=1 Tax=uncultured Methylobacterium sp. TaxID=157278 RepID=UPI0035C9ED9D